MAALNPKGANMFFPNERAGFINFGKNLARINPKAPPSFINLFICALPNLYQLTYCFQLFLLVYLFASLLRAIHEVNHLC